MKVTIIIPNYNGCHFLKRCLPSLARQSFSDFTTILIDNASSDSSISYVTEHFPDIQILPQTSNLGFAEAVNMGICAAKTPYVLLLNTDTVLHPDFLLHMVKCMESSEDIFSVSSKMLRQTIQNVLTAPEIYIPFPAGQYVVEKDCPLLVSAKTRPSFLPVPVLLSTVVLHLNKSDYLTPASSLIWKTWTLDIVPEFMAGKMYIVPMHWFFTQEAVQPGMAIRISKCITLHEIIFICFIKICPHPSLFSTFHFS